MENSEMFYSLDSESEPSTRNSYQGWILAFPPTRQFAFFCVCSTPRTFC